MTQVTYVNITLEEMIELSNCIIIAKKANPSISTKEVDITPFWKRIFGKKYPPFTKITYHFNIIEVLHAERNISKGLKIDVSPANQKNDFEIHKEYCLEGIGESPIYESYNYNMDDATFSGAKFDNSEELILFLNTYYKYFTFVVEGAWESVNLKAKVTDIIKRKNE